MYIGPDTLLPITSLVAAIVGVLLMFWRQFIGFVRRVASAVKRKFSPTDPQRDP